MTATRYDAVIVGTGYAGAVTGARLAQGGMRVLLLERGPWWDSASADRAPSVGRDLPRGIGAAAT
ncbi:NAD(P)-binding protein [Mycolicibacterium porcinum]